MAAANAAGQIVIAWSTADATNKFIFGAVGNPTTRVRRRRRSCSSAPLADALLYYLAAAIGERRRSGVVGSTSRLDTRNIEVSFRPRNGSFQTTRDPDDDERRRRQRRAAAALAIDDGRRRDVGVLRVRRHDSSFVIPHPGRDERRLGAGADDRDVPSRHSR